MEIIFYAIGLKFPNSFFRPPQAADLPSVQQTIHQRFRYHQKFRVKESLIDSIIHVSYFGEEFQLKEAYFCIRHHGPPK